MWETHEPPKRHCWECRRRRLVCDFTHPACNRCSASDVDCPGYGDTPPVRLRWLAPGKVKYRVRKVASNQRVEDRRTADMPDRDKKTNNTAVHLELKSDVHVFLEATQYYNSCIYPSLLPMLQLGPTSSIYRISPPLFQQGMAQPDYIRLIIVCMSLSHRVNHSRNDPRSATLVKSFLHYRGLIIRSLVEDLNLNHKRTSDHVIGGILTLLLVDAQQGASTNWRCHIDGIRQIMGLRGGIQAVARSKGVASLLVSFVYLSVFGDTTSPVSDLAMTESDLDGLKFLIKRDENSSRTFMSRPSALFAEIININYLRVRASTDTTTSPEDHSRKAYEILTRVLDFSPEKWAESKPVAKEDWLLLASIYQAAVSLYCIHSLQSIGVLPITSFLRKNCTAHSHLLHVLLSKAVLSLSIRGFMLWPLVVLGMETVNGGVSVRHFIREELVEMSHYTGSYMPVTAKHVLERFWDSGNTHWDVCFDRSYAFATLLAADASKLE